MTLQCFFSTVLPVISSHLLCELLQSIILKTGLEGYVGNILIIQIQGREKSEKNKFRENPNLLASIGLKSGTFLCS